jgi:hypothetical protein
MTRQNNTRACSKGRSSKSPASSIASLSRICTGSEPEVLFVPCPRSKLESATRRVLICITRYVGAVLGSAWLFLDRD